MALYSKKCTNKCRFTLFHDWKHNLDEIYVEAYIVALLQKQ